MFQLIKIIKGTHMSPIGTWQSRRPRGAISALWRGKVSMIEHLET